MIGQGSSNSRLVIPDGVAVTDNIIAVSDGGTHQVKNYSLQLRYLQSVIGCHGNIKGQFNILKDYSLQYVVWGQS